MISISHPSFQHKHFEIHWLMCDSTDEAHHQLEFFSKFWLTIIQHISQFLENLCHQCVTSSVIITPNKRIKFDCYQVTRNIREHGRGGLDVDARRERTYWRKHPTEIPSTFTLACSQAIIYSELAGGAGVELPTLGKPKEGRKKQHTCSVSFKVTSERSDCGEKTSRSLECFAEE